MRHVNNTMRGQRFFFPLLFLLLALLGGEALAAPPAKDSAVAWSSRYNAAVADFTALTKDSSKGAFRDSWEKLNERFTALRGETKNKPLAAKAAFHAARCLEELARRSWGSADFRAAEKAFADMAKAYPKDALTVEARQRAAALRENAPDPRASAAASKKPAAAQPDPPQKNAAAANPDPAAKSPAAVQPDPKAAAALYKAAAEDWRALLRDSRKGMLRDPWLDLERRFLDALAKDPTGVTGSKAQFQAARCREELADRSRLRSDWQHAVTGYMGLATDFAESDLADDGLFRAAFILSKHLNDPEGARKAAERIVSRYPRGDMAGNARELLASLPPSTDKTAACQKPDPFSQPSLLRQITWKGDAKLASVFLELDRPAAFTHQWLAPAGKNQPARLQLELADTSPAPEITSSINLPSKILTLARTTSPADSSGKNGKTQVTIDLGKIRRYTVTTSLTPPGIIIQASAAGNLSGGLAPPAAGQNGPLRSGDFTPAGGTDKPGTLMEQLGLTVRTIMIDPGHGGKDPGAMGDGIRESTIVLRLAKMLGERLRKNGYTVLYTREKDVYVPLETRTELANKKKADLFLSLHVNANADKNMNGLETYFLDLARTSSAATVAARENAVSVKSISDLQFILTDLMLSAKLQESRELSRLLHTGAFARTQKAGFAVADNGVRSAPFYVLMGARMPAALVEIGYLSNAADAKRLKTDAYLERLADGLADGVNAYKQKLAKFTAK